MQESSVLIFYNSVEYQLEEKLVCSGLTWVVSTSLKNKKRGNLKKRGEKNKKTHFFVDRWPSADLMWHRAVQLGYLCLGNKKKRTQSSGLKYSIGSLEFPTCTREERQWTHLVKQCVLKPGLYCMAMAHLKSTMPNCVSYAFPMWPRGVVMETEAGLGVMVTLVSTECYLSGYWLKTFRSANMTFFSSLKAFFACHHPPSISPPICFLSISRAPPVPQVLFPSIRLKNLTFKCILKEFLALLAQLR